MGPQLQARAKTNAWRSADAWPLGGSRGSRAAGRPPSGQKSSSGIRVCLGGLGSALSGMFPERTVPSRAGPARLSAAGQSRRPAGVRPADDLVHQGLQIRRGSGLSTRMGAEGAHQPGQGHGLHHQLQQLVPTHAWARAMLPRPSANTAAGSPSGGRRQRRPAGRPRCASPRPPSPGHWGQARTLASVHPQNSAAPASDCGTAVCGLQFALPGSWVGMGGSGGVGSRCHRWTPPAVPPSASARRHSNQLSADLSTWLEPGSPGTYPEPTPFPLSPPPPIPHSSPTPSYLGCDASGRSLGGAGSSPPIARAPSRGGLG